MALPQVTRFEPRPGESLASGLGAALVFALGLLVPPAAFIAPFPLMVLRLRAGLGAMLMGTLFAAALVAAALSSDAALLFLMIAVPVVAVADTLARGRGLVRGCVHGFVLLAGQIGIGLLFAADRLRDSVLEQVAVLRSPEFLSDSQLAGEQLEQWTAQVESMEAVLAVVYPAVTIVMAALVVIANASLLRAYLARRDPGWLDGGEFESLRLPLGSSVLFVGAGLSVLLPAARPLAYNVLLLLAFFFALQGLAVVAFYAARLAGPRFLRVAMVVLVLVNPWAAQILGLLGLLDVFLDFRKWAEPPSPKDGR